MIYNNPIAYGVDVTPDVLEALAGTEEIVCVKEESAIFAGSPTLRSLSVRDSVSSAAWMI
jgi:dihydrodipicolinate synthase/N-acetylneuraminate lyase